MRILPQINLLLQFLARSPPESYASITKTKWCDLKPISNKLIPYQFVIESARLKGAGARKYEGFKHVFIFQDRMSNLNSLKNTKRN